MARIDITLAKGESEIEANEQIAKALLYEHGGEDEFEDPLMQQIEARFRNEYDKMLKLTIQEIIEELNNDY